MPDVLSFGEPLLEFSEIPGEAGRYLRGFGGDTSNFVIAAARLGARVAYFTRVGADAFGRQFLELWKREGVDTSAVQADPDAHTGIYFITHTAAGHEFSYLRAGSAASRMRPADLPEAMLREARWLHVSGITQAISASACDAAFRAIELARAAGATVSYDPNLRLKLWPLARARAVIGATAALADVFLPSLEDARALSGREEVDAVFDWCAGLGAPRVALKLGAEGVLLGEAGRRARVAGFRVATVDATGAGDCFDGALVARLLSGDSLETAARYANAAAALATTGYGAVSPLPTPDQVESLLAAQKVPG